MPAFSFQAIDAHIGQWQWEGSAARPGRRLATARRLTSAHGPSWAVWEPFDDAWSTTLEAVERIAIAAMEAGQMAERAADVALRTALSDSYRDVPVYDTSELRKVKSPPRCAVQLHGVGIEIDAGAGAIIRAIGAPRTVVIRTDLPPQLIRAARYVHRQAFHLAEAAMLDMAAQLGDQVPRLEPAVERVAAS